MGIRNTENMRDEVWRKLRDYIFEIKAKTKCNLNSEAVDAEGFFRNLLNLLFKFNLSKDKIESPHNDTIDLHSIDKKICVQVTAQNRKDKVNETVKLFIRKKRFETYKELHFFILDMEKKFQYDLDKLKDYGVRLVFHDISTLFKTLQIDFDNSDSIYEVYDFVMKDFDKEYAEQARKQKKEYRKTHQDDDLKGKHIVDQIYIVLKRFEGFKCIYPRTLAKLYPFNIEKRAYDSYSNYCLKTNNKEIHELLQKVKITDNQEIEISDESLRPHRAKVREIFKRLNDSLIYCICYREKYTEIEHHKISMIKYNLDCTCNECQYQKFNTQPLFNLLKEKYIKHSVDLVEALNEGYYLCKLGEHIKGWHVFNSIAERSKEQKNPVIYFIAEHNNYAIYNFIDSPWWEHEAKALLPKIEEIDLHKILCSLDVHPKVLNELIKVKENYYLNFSREKIEHYATRIKAIKILYTGKGFIYETPPVELLKQEVLLLFVFYSSNSIIKDDFYTFKVTISKAVEAFFESYTTDNRYEYKYKAFDSFILMMMLFYVEEDLIKRIFDTLKIDKIQIAESEKDTFIKSMSNFFASQFTNNKLTGPQFYKDISTQEYFSHYRQLLRHLFNRAMLILSKTNLTSEELKPINQPFTDFLSAAEDFNRTSWEFVAIFLREHIQTFDEKQIKSIIELSISEKKHRCGETSLQNICDIAAQKANFLITDQSFLLKIFNNVSNPCSSCNRIHDMTQILAVWNVADENGKTIIKQKAVHYLEETFDAAFYEKGISLGVFSKDEYTNFLEHYICYAQNNCYKFDLSEEKGRWIVQSYTGWNCLHWLDHMKVDFSKESIQVIAQKSEYYNWLINFENYDYTNFNLKWLTDACPYYLKMKLYRSASLKEKVTNELCKSYNEELAIFFVKYLLKDEFLD